MDEYLRFGWYQVGVVGLMLYSMFSTQSTMFYMTFAVLKPAIICPSNQTAHFSTESPIESISNASSTRKFTEMKEACAEIAAGRCDLHSVVAGRSGFYSVAAEWSLICDKLGDVYAPATWQMLGVLVGAPLFGQLSDWIGRRRTLLFTWSIVGVLQVANSFAPSLLVFTVMRVLIGVVVAGQVNHGISTVYVLTCEFLAPNDRFTVVTLCGWSLVTLPMTALGFLAGNWRRLLWWQGVACVPGLVWLIWGLDESPRWLLAKRRRIDLQRVLLTVVQRNRRTIDLKQFEVDMDNLFATQTTRKPNQRYNWMHLCYTWRLTGYTVALGIAWFTASTGSYSIGFNIGNLASSVFVNIVILCALSWIGEIATFAAGRFLRCAGRKVLLLVLLSWAIVVYVVIVGCVYFDESGTRQIVRFANLAANMALAPFWILIYLLAAELYPTPVRNLANGNMSLFARVGGAVAPQIVFLGEYHPTLAAVLLVIALVVTFAFTILWIDETKGKPLPEEMPSSSERIKFCWPEAQEAAENVQLATTAHNV